MQLILKPKEEITIKVQGLNDMELKTVELLENEELTPSDMLDIVMDRLAEHGVIVLDDED